MEVRRSVVAFSVLLGILLIGGAHAAYVYFKERQPAFLIEAMNAAKPKAPPLPIGEKAPFTPPSGFDATIFVRDVPGARVMTRDPNGTMLVSLTSQGKVVALPDNDQDGMADSTHVVLEGLNKPHGILVSCRNETSDEDPECTLYVAETDALDAYEYDGSTFVTGAVRTLADLPFGDGHFTRTLLMHPDGKRLLVSIGSSCNVCEEEDWRRASVISLDLETGAVSSFATGLRNTVFMAVHPETQEIWGTDNGRDLIGDDVPPDEINIISEGKDYGWPTCFGKNVHDSDFDKNIYIRDPCSDREPSFIDIQAHSAALGLGFIPEEGWPEEYRGDILVALHGSWNRSVPVGYKVVRIRLKEDGAIESLAPEDFLSGFLPSGADEKKALGRPAGLLVEPGAAYVSDDHAGAIYRISPRTESGS